MPKNQKKSLLVTGGAGSIGSHFVRQRIANTVRWYLENQSWCNTVLGKKS